MRVRRTWRGTHCPLPFVAALATRNTVRVPSRFTLGFASSSGSSGGRRQGQAAAATGLAPRACAKACSNAAPSPRQALPCMQASTLRLLASQALQDWGGVRGVRVVVHRGAESFARPEDVGLGDRHRAVAALREKSWLRWLMGFAPRCAGARCRPLPSAEELRKLPAHILRVRLVATDESGVRTLGEYTFAHTPS